MSLSPPSPLNWQWKKKAFHPQRGLVRYSCHPPIPLSNKDQKATTICWLTRRRYLRFMKGSPGRGKEYNGKARQYLYWQERTWSGGFIEDLSGRAGFVFPLLPTLSISPLFMFTWPSMASHLWIATIPNAGMTNTWVNEWIISLGQIFMYFIRGCTGGRGRGDSFLCKKNLSTLGHDASSER